MIRKDLNTKQVGNLFGVNESTVRRWAMSGKIKCISSAGGHRKFSFKNIIQFAKQKGIKINPNNNVKELDESKVIKKMLLYALEHNAHKLETTLIQLYLNGVQLADLMDNYIENILVELQMILDLKKISVVEEHVARKTISKSLNNFKNAIIDTKSNKGENVLCLNLENDVPDLPIDMIEILLENIGFNVHNAGSHTSIDNLKILLDSKKYKAIFIYMCDRQCCTSTVIDNIQKTNEDLKIISELADKYNIKLFLGGPSFENIESDTLKKYTKFTKYSESLILSKS